MDKTINEWSEQEIKRFWDFESKFKGHYFTYANGKQLVNLFKGYMKEKTIVDYGAGSGFFIDHILKRNIEIKGVTAIENSDESIRILEQSFSQSPLYKGTLTVEAVKKTEYCFDTVFAIEVIEHLGDDELACFFDNLRRIMGEESYLIISTPNNEDINFNLVCCPRCEKIFHRWQHVRSWDKDSLSDRLVKEGFTVETIFSTEVDKWTDEYIEANGGTVDFNLLQRDTGSNLIAIARLKNR